MRRKGSLATKLGFFLVAIGSAGGLGNLWRFPYIVGENGGGAFVLLYIFLVLVLGIPLLIGELMLGKSTGKSILTALGSMPVHRRRSYQSIGRMAVILCGMVLAYYSVVSGWVLHFVMHFFLAAFQSQSPAEFSGLSALSKNGLLQSALASVHLLLCIFVVAKGVQEGIEKFISWTIPLFGLLLLLLMVKSLALPSAPDALRFLFYPDFSKLTARSLGQAVGQVLFTLSLGFGTMVTFGSYMGDEDIPAAGVRVALVDTLISLISGLLIFPIVLQASNIRVGDPGLLFEALPKFLLELPGGWFFGLAFFICLYLAALGASIGLLEVIVANLVDRTRLGRNTAAWISGAAVFALSLLPALSSAFLQVFHLGDFSALEMIDSGIINLALPILALGISFALVRGLTGEEQERLFVGQAKVGIEKAESRFLFPYWQFALRLVVPITIVAGLVFMFISILM